MIATLLELFWVFFKIGLFTVGGGYAMIPMITNELIVRKGWITAERLTDIISIAESTPGSFAINAATFIGNSQAGLLGGLVATLAVVLPSLIIIMIVSLTLSKFLNSKQVRGYLLGVQPVVVGLICYAVFSITKGVVLAEDTGAGLEVKWVSLLLTACMFALSFVKINKKSVHPLMLIGVAATCGVLVFGVLGLEG